MARKVTLTAALVLAMVATVLGCIAATAAFNTLSMLPLLAIQTWVLVKGVEGVARIWGCCDVMGDEVAE